MKRIAHSVVRKIILSAAALALLLCASLPTLADPPVTKPAAKSTTRHASGLCTVHSTTYDGWKAEQMSNAWVKLIFVPQLGGRLMQVTFGDHDYLFVNDQLKGQVLPVDTEHHRWFNYGGDKIWPMPEGNDDEQHWAGAGGAILDESAFTLKVISRGTTCTVRLTGPVDPQIGQQYIRDVSIGTTSPVISFHAVMKNVSGYPQKWSEQSVSQYNAAKPGDPTTFNPKFWGLTPANPTSVFPNGYFVRSGSKTNPAYSVSDGLFRVHWGAIGGEVWADSPAGWLAVVDGTTDYTMIERNRFDAKAEYPGQATMLFYTTGLRNRRPPTAPAAGAAATTPTAPTTPAAPPAAGAPPATGPGNGPGRNGPPILYMEAEVNSPVVTLWPGESYAMDSYWYPTRMGEDFKTATYSGVVGTPLAAAASTAGLTLSGNFGVYYAGTLVAHFYDRGGSSIGSAKLIDVTPLDAVNLQSTVQAPPGTFRVSLHVVDKSGLDRGPLGEAFVNPPPPAPRRRGYSGDGN